MSFTLTDSTVRLLRRVHTSLGDAEYDGNSDTLIVRVSPPVVPSVRIRLHRIDQEDETVDTFSDAHMALGSGTSGWRRFEPVGDPNQEPGARS